MGQIPINIAELVGDTPLVGLPQMLEGSGAAEGVELLAKLESLNPGGSVKDRIGVAMLEAAERRRAESNPDARRSSRRPAATPGSLWPSSVRGQGATDLDPDPAPGNEPGA